MTAAAGNDDQIAFWNGPGGERWVRTHAERELALQPYGDAIVARVKLRPGERALDVGCGCGTTSLALAENGEAVGIDVSEPMLALARARAEQHPRVTFLQADASTHTFERPFDALASRFGVMFFNDPTGAFTNLHRALRPGGRLAFACWAPPAENPWYSGPAQIAAELAPPSPPSAPDAPGPFAFADPARVERILGDAGFSSVAFEKLSPGYPFGPDLDQATTFAFDSGPAARTLQDAGEPTRAEARTRIRALLAPHQGPRGVVLPSAVWIVTALRA